MINYSKLNTDNQQNQNSKPKKILIVDDDQSVRSLLSLVFETKYKVVVASNGEEALSELTKNFFDLVFTDCDMPVMDGIELFKQASRTIKDVNRKFIFNTGLVTTERESYFKENNVKYLVKPSSIQEIRAIVDNSIYEQIATAQTR